MSDSFKWNVKWEVRKYNSGSVEDVVQNKVEPYDIVKREGNLLTYEGAGAIWEYMLGNGTPTAGSSLAYFNNANSYIAVGTSTTNAAATQTDLQSGSGTASRVYGPMDSTYPSHTNSTAGTAATITFQSTFGAGTAAFDWNEWGIFNGTVPASRILNRKVEYLGSKLSSDIWTININITLS
jgi:hypothetical protein